MTTEYREPELQECDDDEAPITPSDENAPGDEVEALIVKAHDSHLAASRAAEAAKDHLRFAIETGESLKKLKDLIGHGRWLRWFAENEPRLGFSTRTATDYMKMAELSDKDRQRAADLTSIRSVLKAFKKGRTHERPPSPTLSEPYSVLVDAVIRCRGADALLAYIRGLDEANEVSRAKFEEAVRAVQEEWGAP